MFEEQRNVVKELDTLFPTAKKIKNKRKNGTKGKVHRNIAYLYEENEKEWQIGVTCDDGQKKLKKKMACRYFMLTLVPRVCSIS